MATFSSDLSVWLSARTLAEKKTLLDLLAVEMLAREPKTPLPIHDPSQRTVAFVVPGETPPDRDLFEAWLAQPGVKTEIQRRIDQPGEALSLDEFMVRYRRQRAERAAR